MCVFSLKKINNMFKSYIFAPEKLRTCRILARYDMVFHASLVCIEAETFEVTYRNR